MKRIVAPYFELSRWMSLLQNVMDAFAYAFEDVKNTVDMKMQEILGIVQAACDGMKSELAEVESAIDGVIASMNQLNSMGSVNISSGVTVKVGGYAAGGFPEKASLFWAGENGVPELMGTIGGQSAVAGGDEITGIRQAVYDSGETQASLLQTAITLLQVIAEKDTSITLDGRELVEGLDVRRSRNGWAF